MERTLRPCLVFLAFAVTALGCRSATAAPSEVDVGLPEGTSALPAVETTSGDVPEPRGSGLPAAADVPGADGFLVLAEDGRVQFEPGVREFAVAIAAELDSAYARAEVFHGLRFERFPPIRVFATRESYARATLSPGARGSCVMGVLCFSPKLWEMRATLPGVVVHELSHALLLQNVGLWTHNTKIPAWFREGLATLASDGAGAEGMDPAQAERDIAEGRGFDLSSSAARLRGIPEGVTAAGYYRQASLFVGWLRAADEAAFPAFLTTLRGRDFDEAFAEAFGDTPQELWRAFARSLTPR